LTSDTARSVSLTNRSNGDSQDESIGQIGLNGSAHAMTFAASNSSCTIFTATSTARIALMTRFTSARTFIPRACMTLGAKAVASAASRMVSW
jgi:hypothetical protein